MNKAEMIEDRMISDISKGRYPKSKVKDIIQTMCRIVGKEVEKNVFEYCWLFCLQTLHYEFGFGRVRLERFFNEAAKAVDAFDSGVFSIDDMRQALKDDAGFECYFNWGEEE